MKRWQMPAWVLVTLLLVLSAAVGGKGPEAGQMTVSTVTALDGLPQGDVVLATLTAGKSSDDAVYTVRWRQDETGWFPVWHLELVSDVGLLPGTGGPEEQTPGGPQVMTLVTEAPMAGHSYATDISYDRVIGVLQIRVRDTTVSRNIYAHGFTVPAYDGPLHAPTGDVIPEFLPVGLTWRLGVKSATGAFVALHHFDTRDEQAGLQLHMPGLNIDNLRITIQTDADEHLVIHPETSGSEAEVAWAPLPLDVLPFGTSTARLDYVVDDRIVFSEQQPLSLGRVEVWIAPLQADREQGVIETTATILSSEAVAHPLAVTVWADLYTLRWDEARRDFDDVLYDRILLYDGPLDLTHGEAELSLAWTLPQDAANWKAVIDVSLRPQVQLHVGNKERLFSTHAPAQINHGESYTIAVLPDTQYFSKTYPALYTRMTDWLTANAQQMAIAAVLHVGDITDNNSPSQWENAYASMSLLHDVIPYVFTIGNHDMVAPDGSAMRGHSRVNTYFPASMAAKHSNLVATMVPGRMENHYALLSVAGDEYVIVSLEFWPPDDALAWAEEVAQNYPDHRLMLLTHAYLSGAGKLAQLNYNYPLTQDPETTVNPGTALWDQFVRLQNNAFMTISGHVLPAGPTVPYRINPGVAGHPVFQLVFNWQNQPIGGNGWLGLMTFHPDDTVDVTVYSPYLGEWADTLDTNGFTSNLTLHLTEGTAVRQPRVNR